MKKKLVAVMMCAAMVAMLGVGCGSKSSDDSSSKSETKKTLTEDLRTFPMQIWKYMIRSQPHTNLWNRRK